MEILATNKGPPTPKAMSAASGLMSFGNLKRQHNILEPLARDEISIPTGLFRDLLKLSLNHVRVDEAFYLRTYPDVVEALDRGAFTCPRHHYLEFGYFEDRLPSRVEVDEEFYFRTNPDIKASVAAGLMPSAQVHFERHGFKEGRLPREGWLLSEI